MNQELEQNFDVIAANTRNLVCAMRDLINADPINSVTQQSLDHLAAAEIRMVEAIALLKFASGVNLKFNSQLTSIGLALTETLESIGKKIDAVGVMSMEVATDDELDQRLANHEAAKEALNHAGVSATCTLVHMDKAFQQLKMAAGPDKR